MICDDNEFQLMRADVYSVGALMYRVIVFVMRPWHHLEEMKDARRADNGGHNKALEIIRSEVCDS